MKKVSLFFLILISGISLAQTNNQWKGYFSYNAIKDISIGTNKVFAAADNSYFTKDFATNTETKVTSVEGLSGQDITQIYHSEAFKKTIIGHADGLLIVVNEVTGEMLNVVDIVNKVTVPSGKKRINHFNEFNGNLYIATDYGISVFNLLNSEFGDSFFIGPNGANIEVFQTTVFNNSIYAVTNGYGILKATVTNPFLVDFNQWTMAQPGSWKSIQATSTNLAVLNLGGSLYDLSDSNVLTFITTFPQVPVDIRYANNLLVITAQNYFYAYTNTLSEQFNINNTSNASVRFTCGTVLGNQILIGTAENGLLQSTIANPTQYTNITPSGPIRNKVFGVKANYKGFWAVYGDYTSSLNPYPLDSFGISRFKDDNWIHVPYSDVLEAKSIVSITNNPTDSEEFYFSSFYSGILKVKNEIPEIIYNKSNSSLSSILNAVPDDIRVGVSNFDRSENLWSTTAFTTNQLHVLKQNNTWQSYKMDCLPPGLPMNCKGVIVDKNNTKWLYSRIGLMAFNETSNKCLLLNNEPETGNLPARDVRTVAIDKRNKVWIGTPLGLRTISSADAFLSDDKITPNPIIFLEDNVPQELLYQQYINEIVVDGANNKWIATGGSGIFYVSDDGQKTIYHFTRSNSPLPNDNVIDIDINEATGEVFIATDSGMVSFKGSATSGAENFKNTYAFPNPVRPEFKGNVSITGLMNKASVKITDIEGNLVHEFVSEGGTVLWDTSIFGKKKVASGVYLIHLSSEDGLETEVKKVMIVR